MGKDVIIACDFSSKEETMKFLDLFEKTKPFVKIGMELFYGAGPDIVRAIKDRGHKVFLDLKLHDIPNTVEKAMEVVAGLGADIVNVHAAGGIEMMRGAKRGATDEKGNSPLIIAVTQLTSTSQEIMERDLLINQPIEDVVRHYALNAKNAGLNGVVCSPKEVAIVHNACGNDFLTVTPGIRFSDDSKGDQKRVMTPAEAGRIGSDLIVVGRSITASADPVKSYERCINEFCKGR